MLTVEDKLRAKALVVTVQDRISRRDIFINQLIQDRQDLVDTLNSLLEKLTD